VLRVTQQMNAAFNTDTVYSFFIIVEFFISLSGNQLKNFRKKRYCSKKVFFGLCGIATFVPTRI
jgi:hypothetical protein